MASSDRVVELLNTAQVESEWLKKLEALKIVQELILKKEPELLDNFLNEVTGFQTDRSQEVRKFIVGFIEEVCKVDADNLLKVAANLKIFMTDTAVVVRKRVILAMTHLYKLCLAWISKSKNVNEDMEAVWDVMHSIKLEICTLIDADNDGVRTNAVKFMEMVIISQTPRSSDVTTTEFCLDDIPMTLKLLRRRKLEEEASEVLDQLIKYHESSHITSTNLITCMGALTNIAKLRPAFMSKVITSLEMIQANLPPTLSKSQVTSVRKHLKNQLLALLKQKRAEEFFTNITTLLTDLGASREEVMRAMPNFEEVKRKMRKSEASQPSAKRAKKDVPEDDEDDDEDEEDDDPEPLPRKTAASMSTSQVASAVDITEKFILDRMTPGLATELVMHSMSKLPIEIPPQFHNTYTPIAAAGTDGQVKHVARLLATQLTAAKLGPGVEAVQKAKNEAKLVSKAADGDEAPSSSGKISTVIHGTTTEKGEKSKKSKVMLTPAGISTKKAKAKTFKLADVTRELNPAEMKSMKKGALSRLLSMEGYAERRGLAKIREKLITALTPHFSDAMKVQLENFILSDLKNRSDLAFSWLYEEYSFFQGFNRAATLYADRNNDDSSYNKILCGLISGVMNRSMGKEREQMMRRLYLESPIITDGAIQLLKNFVTHDDTAIAVVLLMRDLVSRRPAKRLNFLTFLLEFCSHEAKEVRNTANDTVLQLYNSGDFKEIIEQYSSMYLQFLLSPSPPDMLFGEERGRATSSTTWTDGTVKACLYLFLNLLPHNLTLFKELARVYVETSAEIKRNILKLLDLAVQKIDMNNPLLLELVEKSPKGSETLVTKVIHILTDKTRPTSELASKVKEMYETRVSNVRFLIPVLNGLSKQEVTNVLPEIIKLTNQSPLVVKDVFKRLWSAPNGPMSASDLLIALHNIDANKVDGDMRTVIKSISFCLQEKAVFTQEVLSIVLQQLLEQPVIPLLFMRTVIQSVGMYPKITKFVINILKRLIVKQVWKEDSIWKGFVKCCEMTVPHSYAAMLQLPPVQLRMLLDAAPKLKDPLLEHVQSFNEAERAHVPANVIGVLYQADTEAMETDEALKKETEETESPKNDGEEDEKEK